MRCQQRDDVRPHAGHQPQYEDGGVQLLVKLHRRHRVRAVQKGDEPHIPEHGGLGVVDAGKGVEAFGAGLAGAGAQDDLVVKYQLHAPGKIAAGIQKGAIQVVAGVRIAVVDGFLAAGQHHRLGAVLDHIAQRGGGVGHCVGAVGNDETIVGIVVLADGMDQLLPLFRAYVGRVQTEQLHRVDLAEFGQLRHERKELFRCNGRRQAAGGGGFAGDGAASGEE